jgi:hypothetical protein
LRGGFSLSSYPFKQFLCRFIAGVLWYQFATKGLGQNGLCQLVHLGLGGGVAGLKLVSQFKQPFNPADDFLLFGEGGRFRGNSRTLVLVDNSGLEGLNRSPIDVLFHIGIETKAKDTGLLSTQIGWTYRCPDRHQNITSFGNFTRFRTILFHCRV